MTGESTNRAADAWEELHAGRSDVALVQVLLAIREELRTANLIALAVATGTAVVGPEPDFPDNDERWGIRTELRRELEDEIEGLAP